VQVEVLGHVRDWQKWNLDVQLSLWGQVFLGRGGFRIEVKKLVLFFFNAYTQTVGPSALIIQEGRGAVHLSGLRSWGSTSMAPYLTPVPGCTALRSSVAMAARLTDLAFFVFRVFGFWGGLNLTPVPRCTALRSSVAMAARLIDLAFFCCLGFSGFGAAFRGLRM
jgi:hypothetical protein